MAGVRVVKMQTTFHVLVPIGNAKDGQQAMDMAMATVKGGNVDRYDMFAAYYRGKDLIADGVRPMQMYVVDVVAEKVL